MLRLETTDLTRPEDVGMVLSKRMAGDVVKAVITKHVEATKKLKRFDMINEEEVAVLETAIRD